MSPSRFPHEREALDWVRERLPDQEPWRAWSNFEMVADDGSVNEIDLLVLSPAGLFLIEIKSWPGALRGDAGTWTRRHDGRDTTFDNPLSLANLKAKRLKSLLQRQAPFRKHRMPFVDAVLFLSATNLEIKLDPEGQHHVYARDGSNAGAVLGGLIGHLQGRGPSSRPSRLEPGTPLRLERALDGAGIRKSQSHRKVGDYELQELLHDGAVFQDWSAKHRSYALERRIRIYPTASPPGSASRETLKRAAQREIFALEGIKHPGILAPRDLVEHELGPALIFDHHPGSQRLDHYLKASGASLSTEARLHLARSLGEILRYAHGKRLFHRALSPQSILVRDPQAERPEVMILDWHAGERASGGGATRTVTATSHAVDLVESAATAYMAPEVRLAQRAEGAPADIFSLGAIFYHLFSGRPPAASGVELAEILHTQGSLRLSAAIDGVPEALELLVSMATAPVVSERLGSVDELLTLLEDEVWEELTRPDEPETADPADARPGQLLDGGFEVKKRLGQGSTSWALLVEREGQTYVLKIARDAEHDQTLRDEAEVLRKLRHQYVVELLGTVTVGGRTGILMARAGHRTLGDRLRREGRLSLELLERFGDDLLSTVAWLEENGIAHRDIKPDNLGIQSVGSDDALHLVMFDFSLSRAPAENLRVGTPPYLDPFLVIDRSRKRWDLAAERFAAAMTLHEMASGRLPQWGDGRSDPAYLTDEVKLDAEAFEPAVRQGLIDFFTRALKRQATDRHDNAHDMQREWRQVFVAASRPVVPSDHPEDATGAGEITPLLRDATLDTEIIDLGLSTRAFHALEKIEVDSVRDLLGVAPGRFKRFPGVGKKTRDELLEAITFLRERFPGALPERTEAAPGADSGGGAATEEEPATAGDSTIDDRETPATLSALSDRLVPKASLGAASQAIPLLLGLEQPPGIPPWPTQLLVSDKVGVTRARVGQLLGKARERWRKMPALTPVRDEIHQLLQARAGVMSAEELVEALLASRGEDATSDLTAAGAVVRAAVEAEAALESPRWQQRRRNDRLLVALDHEAGVNASALADWAALLGREADRLAGLDPLPSPEAVAEALRAIHPPGDLAIPHSRLVRLAAAASQTAAVSGRLELYPRGMPADRALKLAGGVVIAGLRQTLIKPKNLQDRVKARYPEAEPLPAPPALDDILRGQGLNLTWDADESAYRFPPVGGIPSTTGTWSHISRAPKTPPPPTVISEAQELDQRLARALAEGGLLLLPVVSRWLVDAEEALSRRFDLALLSLDKLLIEALRSAAENAKVDWKIVLQADAAPPASRDATNLQRLVDRALPQVEKQLLGHEGSMLLTQPGLLARWDRLGLLERLRDVLARPPEDDRALTALWVLIPGDEQSDLPRLEGKTLPVIGRSEWVRVTRPWLQRNQTESAA